MDVEPLMNGVQKRSEEQRPLTQPCNQEEFNSAHQYITIQEPGKCKRVRERISSWDLKCFFITLFPVFKWLPRYQWKQDFLSDLISGFTVAVMHIPQGMAYSSLAGVPPIVGIYMAFFPVIVYFFCGSSRHVSMGTFAVVCMMVSKPIQVYSTPPDSHHVPVFNITSTDHFNSPDEDSPHYTPVQVGTAVCFVVGFWQVLLGICRLGSLSVLMSETLVSGFTTGAAVLVLTSQVKHAFGIKLPRITGPLKLVNTYIRLLSMIEQTNLLALSMTVTVVVILFLFFKFVKPKLESQTKIPVPMELIMITLGTLISRYFYLHDNYNISVVGEIPTGLPGPALPPFELIPYVLVDGLAIAIVAFSVNISMASLFARKENYKVDANQELLASGFGNLVGSLFSCLPFSASLSRSLIQHGVGGKTQVASIISCSILALVLLYIGPFFESLPNCVLAGIILFALKGMLKQVMDFPKAWRHSRSDGIIWLFTFLSVILMDIDVGLSVGIIVSLVIIILKGQNPNVHILGNLPNTDIYLESGRYQTAVPVCNTLILRICGGLHFANKINVQTKVEKLLKKELKDESNPRITKLIIDMSAVTFVDPASSKALLHLDQDSKSQNISLCLARCSGHVYDQLKRCEFFSTFPEARLFPSIHDAVTYSLTKDSSLVKQSPSNVQS